MTISLNWLRDYLDCDLTPDEIAVILTDLGLEVDRFERREQVPGGLAGVVAGHVLTCAKHPDADKLSVTTVDVGDEVLQIVCGAPNVAAGQKVLVATVGTVLGEDFKIKKSKIRGVESLGMICAEDELGLGRSHEGIMVLGADVVPGTAARDVLGFEDDYIIEIGLTPNRVDGASHWGVARDLAAWLKARGRRVGLHLPTVESLRTEGSRAVEVDVVDKEGAPRYSGVTISGLRVGPSPEWLQKRLRAVGLTPHNNVVDVTNYVLHEVGQPLHAFDADKIEGGKIVVRTCEEGTPFVTLDGVERRLSAEDLMICDAAGPMCMAGVYGGLDSGVSEGTSSVFLESAYFSPSRIRRTARRHGLSTDASFRYERGADPNMVPWALRRAALLISELAGGEVSPVADLYPERVEDFYVEVDFEGLASLIGKDLGADKVCAILEALGIHIVERDERGLVVLVPPFRVDVQREADVAEEILRVYGYNNIENPEGLRSAVAYAPKPDVRRLTNGVSDFLSALGFSEAMSNSLTSAAYYEGLSSYPVENCVRILNPLSSDLGVMRQTLLFGALEAVRLNINHRNPDLKLYEFGNVYRYEASRAGGDLLAPYSEFSHLAITVSGDARAASWNAAAEEGGYFFLRGVAEKLLSRFGLNLADMQACQPAADLFAGGLALSLRGKHFMNMGVVAPSILAKFDIKQAVGYLEMDFGALLQATKNHAVKVAELSRYPEVRRDLALLVDGSVTFAVLRQAALRAEKKLLREVTLFDVYQGDKLPAGKKSYALGFVLQDATRTLTDADIDRIMQSIASRLEKDCGATVRS